MDWIRTIRIEWKWFAVYFSKRVKMVCVYRIRLHCCSLYVHCPCIFNVLVCISDDWKVLNLLSETWIHQHNGQYIRLKMQWNCVLFREIDECFSSNLCVAFRLHIQRIILTRRKWRWFVWCFSSNIQYACYFSKQQNKRMPNEAILFSPQMLESCLLISLLSRPRQIWSNVTRIDLHHLLDNQANTVMLWLYHERQMRCIFLISLQRPIWFVYMRIT